MDVVSVHVVNGAIHVRGPEGTLVCSPTRTVRQLLIVVPNDNPVPLKHCKNEYNKVLAEYDKTFELHKLCSSFTLNYHVGQYQSVDQDYFAAQAFRDEIKSGKYIGLVEFVEPHPSTYDLRLAYAFDGLQTMPVARILIPYDGMWRLYYTVHLKCQGIREIGAVIGVDDG